MLQIHRRKIQIWSSYPYDFCIRREVCFLILYINNLYYQKVMFLAVHLDCNEYTLEIINNSIHNSYKDWIVSGPIVLSSMGPRNSQIERVGVFISWLPIIYWDRSFVVEGGNQKRRRIKDLCTITCKPSLFYTIKIFIYTTFKTIKWLHLLKLL
jgi:hypothetical protein